MSIPRAAGPLSILAAGVLGLGSASGAHAADLRVRASQDTQVDATAPRRADGAARQMHVSARPLRRALLRFDLRGLAGTPERAALQLYVSSRSGGRVSVSRIVAGQRWSERRTTFRSAPAVERLAKRSKRATRPGWATVDVSTLISAGRFSDLAVTGAPGAMIASRESADPPQLVITPATPSPSALPLPLPEPPFALPGPPFTPPGPPFTPPGPPTTTPPPADVAPTVVVTGADTTDEGTTRRFTYTVTDPDSTPAVTESCGDAAQRTGTTGPGSFECSFPDGPAKSTVSVTADDGTTVGSDEIVVTVANVAPTATLSNSGPITEGAFATIAFAGEADPSPADTAAGFRYALHCDGSPFEPAPSYADASTQPSTSCRFDERGSKTVRGRILDKDGGFREYTTDVTVTNAAPAVAAAPDQSADEGSATGFELGSFIDAGGDGGPWTVDVDWGDGSAHTVLSRILPGTLGNAGHAYADGPAAHTVSVTVTDSQGGSDTDSFQVSVKNVAPALTAAGDQTAQTGTTATIDLGSVTDPNPGDGPWTVAVDWGDGSPSTNFEVTTTGPLGTRDHTYLRDGDHAVRVSVTDKDGETGTAPAFTVTSTPAAATLTVVLDATPSSSQDFSFTIAGDAGEPARDFVLDDDDDPGHLSERVFDVSGDGFGRTTITQAPARFWALDALSCTGDPDATAVPADRRLELVVDPGEEVVCTFRNRRVASTVGGVFPESSSDIGPIEDGNGNLYTVTELAALDSRPCLRKSADGGRSWTEVDGANRPSYDDLESVSLVKDRENPYRVHMLMQRSGTNRVSYNSFNMSDAPSAADTWQTKNEIVAIPGSNPDEAPVDQYVSLVQRSDGDLIAFYATRKTVPGPGGLEQVGFKSKSGGVWGPEQLLVPSPTASHTQAVAAMGDGDVTHVFYKNQTAQRVWYRTLDPDGTLGVPKELTDYGTNSARHIIATPVAHLHVVRPPDGQTVERFVVGWKRSTGGTLNGAVVDDGVVGPETQVSDVPVLSNPSSTQSAQAVAGFVADDAGDRVYAVYSDDATHDLHYDVLPAGGPWGTDVKALAGHEVMAIQPTVFTHRPADGGAKALGVLFDDNVGFETLGLDNVPRYTDIRLG